MFENNSQIIIYQTEDGQLNINVSVEEDTVWLTQEQMSHLFDKSRSTINEHIQNIYKEKELYEESSIKKFGISEFANKPKDS